MKNPNASTAHLSYFFYSLTCFSMTRVSISRAEWLLTVLRPVSDRQRIKSTHFKDLIGGILIVRYRCVTTTTIEIYNRSLPKTVPSPPSGFPPSNQALGPGNSRPAFCHWSFSLYRNSFKMVCTINKCVFNLEGDGTAFSQGVMASYIPIRVILVSMYVCSPFFPLFIGLWVVCLVVELRELLKILDTGSSLNMFYKNILSGGA